LRGTSIGVHEKSEPFLDQANRGVRLVVGHLSHRDEEKVLTDPKTHEILATVVEKAITCYLQ
ncbi:MAG: hypothetical protein AAGJ35_15665, partial [Myxococcota bacterium]